MKIEWEDCICGNLNVHTLECKHNHRKNYIHNHSVVVRKVVREERVKKNLCASCGKKAEKRKCPHCKKVIGYRYRCKKCNKKIEEYNKRRKNEKINT